ncbi:MAG TPA: Trm112 family protein [Devosia sp.]|nr:Trm112 family protein [Devosia sp.]
MDPLALEMLVCPLTKTQLTLNSSKTELISAAARIAFPISKGVPLLCVTEARSLSEEEIQKLK